MREAAGSNPGWVVVGVLAALAVVWLTATTFGVPGLFLARATSDPTPRTATAPSTTPAPRTPPAIAPPASAPPASAQPTSALPASAPSSAATVGSAARGLVAPPVIDRPTEPPAATTPTGPTPSAPTGTEPAGTEPAGTEPQPSAPNTPDRAEQLAAAVRASQASCPRAASGVQEHASHAAGRKTVALTFDDGPGEATPEVLEVLAREHVHATFFVIGRQASLHPQLVRRAVQEGHLIGNHTFDHVYPRDLRGGWSPAYLRSQLFRTSEVVYRATGQPTCFFRPPGGFLPGTVLPAARGLRMTTALWSVDTRDWEVQGPHAPSAAKRGTQSRTILYRAVAGGKQDPHPIVLFHDGGGYRGSTAAALTRVIDWYRANGFTFVRLDGQV